MSQDDLRRQIERHYAGQGLDAARLERLARIDAGSLPAEPAARHAPARRWALAAVVIVLLSGNVYFGLRSQRAWSPPNGAAVAGAPTVTVSGPRFVALRSFAARCPHCGQTLAPFQELERRFGARGVLFVSREVGDAEARERSRELCATLGADGSPARCCEIRLIDRTSGALAARFTSGEPAEPFERAFAAAVEGR